jgi:hypothetical protein
MKANGTMRDKMMGASRAIIANETITLKNILNIILMLNNRLMSAVSTSLENRFNTRPTGVVSANEFS